MRVIDERLMKGDWRTYTPAELGRMLDPSQDADTVNALLADAGMQYMDASGKWAPTPAAVYLFGLVDENPRLQWFPAVLAKITSTKEE
jgi:hypothetical protein